MGAKQGNQNARKVVTGKAFTTYLSAEDMELLRAVLQQHGLPDNDNECVKLARRAAKTGINRLLLPDEFEKLDRMYALHTSAEKGHDNETMDIPNNRKS